MTNSDENAGTVLVDPTAYGANVSPPDASDAAHSSPSALRNTSAILEVLARFVPSQAPSNEIRTGLEIASGSGQHAIAYAERFPHVAWTPSDPTISARQSISAWRDKSALPNLHPPLDINLTTPAWQTALTQKFDVTIANNVVHISPWRATLGLLHGAEDALTPGGLLFIYSCFYRDGDTISQSNVDFDRSLRARNPEWGVRDTSEVIAAAETAGLSLEELIEMPANNHALALRKPAAV